MHHNRYDVGFGLVAKAYLQCSLKEDPDRPGSGPQVIIITQSALQHYQV